MKKSGLTKIAFLAFVLSAASCDNVFIPDPIDPRLPKYTESGNNVAGALIDDEIWRSEADWDWSIAGGEWINNASVAIWAEKDSVVLRFPGRVGDCNADIEFHLKSEQINSFDDVIKLQGYKIELDGIENYACFVQCGDTLINGIGQFYPKYIKKTSSSSNIIFAGTFGFSANNAQGKIKQIGYGRFDYHLNKEEANDSLSEQINQGNYQ